MRGQDEFLTYIIEGKQTRFVIPVYQRNYDWKIEQCKRLFDDLESVATTGAGEHFFGSIVSKREGNSRVVIDGQQRITTVFLVLAALVARLRDEGSDVTSSEPNKADYIEGQFLIDAYHPGEQKLRLKLVKKDMAAFSAIMSGGEDPLVEGSNVTRNYRYFLRRIDGMGISADQLFDAIERLKIIDVQLEERDDAQRVFESLNSTGLDLTEADKIRNFILMDLSEGDQESYYEKYWVPVEENASGQVSDFVRYHLAAAMGKTPAMGRVYQSYVDYARKRYSLPESGRLDTKSMLDDLLLSSRRFRTASLPDTGSERLDSVLRRIGLLQMNVVLPFTLNLLSALDAGSIDADQAAECLEAVESYLFRRWSCGIPTNALNKVFETLHADAMRGVSDGASYPEAVRYSLLHKTGTGRFPSDQEFLESIATRDYYRIGNRKLYLYDRLENGGSKERVDVVGNLRDDRFSVEHIMPQTLTRSWKQTLGEDWERIHDTWKDRLANLTLTAYNSEYSNRDFRTKRDMENGFRDSAFRINRWVCEQESWGERELEERQLLLQKRFLELWPMISSDYVPHRELPDEATLADETEFTNRRIVAYSFLGDLVPVKTWKEMEVGVLRSLSELDLSRLYSISQETSYPGSAFEHDEGDWYAKVCDGIFVNTRTSTSSKVELLRRLLDIFGIDREELTIRMAPIDKLEVPED
ncbi:MAG: DUF262 domain-containing protein [Tractidigestivibacter sp.]|jgi:uncharacterized protein with ParB-like and HNH nuclease domain|uniref:DUF262 domain-containing protein n=1 Tax=Tractidigestivibacter sp. TaxID=2847320 RepID=UPI003D92EBD0